MNVRRQEEGKSAQRSIFNEILNDCVDRVNKELLDEKTIAWSQQLINIPVRMSCAQDESDTGCALDEKIVKQKILNYHPSGARVIRAAPYL